MTIDITLVPGAGSNTRETLNSQWIPLLQKELDNTSITIPAMPSPASPKPDQ